MTSKPTVSNRVTRCSVSIMSPSAIWRVTSRAGSSFPRATSGRLVVVGVRTALRPHNLPLPGDEVVDRDGRAPPAKVSPSWTCRPCLRSEWMDWLTVKARPSASIETWTPPPVASLTACATCSGERPRAWNVTTPYPASGSSPSHSGCRCVPSKRVLVLYSSYFPSKAADLVRFRRLATSVCVSGLNVRTASRAWSRIS